MSQRYTLDVFISKSRAIHGNKYDYSEVIFTKVTVPVKIIHPEFGAFFQRPNLHMKGCGHKNEGFFKTGRRNSYSTEVFIEKAKAEHGELYDYSLVDYKKTMDKIVIIDPEFGRFEITANSHLMGSGHPKRGLQKSAASRKIGTAKFIERALLVHGNRYDYSKVDYTHGRNKVIIIDNHHNNEEFLQCPEDHIRGHGNPNRVRLPPYDIDHIIPLAIIRDRTNTSLYTRERPLMKFLDSDINLRKIPKIENLKKCDSIIIGGIRINARECRNNYEIIWKVVKEMNIDHRSVHQQKFSR
jgi:hypothetical protein